MATMWCGPGRIKSGPPGKRWWLKAWRYPGVPIPPRHQDTYEVKTP